MTSRERFLTALHGRRPDRTPLAHVSALTTLELQDSTGCFMPDVHHDPDKLVTLCGANHDVLGFDAVSFIINYFSEPAALGCEINWGARTELPVYKSHPWASPAAACPADLLDRKPIANCLATLRLARKRYGDELAVLGKVMGPFSMVMVMHGLENVMMATLDAPEKIAAFLAVATDILVEHANAQFDAGADAVAIGEGGAGANMLSPEMYESLLLPTHQEMVRRIKGPTIMHICGDITPRLDALKKIGLKCFNFDWAIPPAKMRQASGAQGGVPCFRDVAEACESHASPEKRGSMAPSFSIMGNVNTSDLLLAAPATIESQVRDCLNANVDIISPGCAVSPKCPNKNLRAMADAIAKWGK